MSAHKLKASDVEFTVEVEPEDIPVRGNAMCSGDDEADRALEDQIIAALDRGQVEAWCCIVVKATWKRDNTFQGVDTLGGCCFLEPIVVEGGPWSIKRQIEEHVKAHCMRENALDDLNREIVRARKQARQTLKATAR